MQKSGMCFTLHTTSNTLAVFVFQALVLSAIDVLFQGEMRGKFFWQTNISEAPSTEKSSGFFAALK